MRADSPSFGFTVAPIVAGLDKFTNLLTDWTQYLAPFVADIINAQTFMYIVGVVEIVAGIGVALKPRIFAYVVSAWLVGITGDWRPIFWFGFAITAATFPLLLIMPESLQYLVGRRPQGALQKINKLLPRLGMEPVQEMPAPLAADADTSLYRALLTTHRRSLFLITAAYFMFAAALYFPLQWITYMLTQSGLSPEMGISGSALMNGGGVIGGIVFGLIAARWGGLRNTVPAFMLIAFASIVAFGFMTDLTLMLVLGTVIGFGLIGTVSGLYATYPIIFPPAVRTTGAGIVIGVGRIGGIISPVVAGYMIEGGVARPIYCILLALPLIVAVLLLRAINELKSPMARGVLDREMPV